MTAKALICWAYSLAVLTVGISPLDVEPVLSGIFNLFFEGRELFFIHHFATISITYNILVVNISLDMGNTLPIHY